MWFRKASPRRQAIREDVAEAESLSRPNASSARAIALIASIFFIVAAALQFWPGDPLPYRMGEIAPTDLRSPISFVADNPVQTERNREVVRGASPAVLVADTNAFDHIYNQLINLKPDLQ